MGRNMSAGVPAHIDRCLVEPALAFALNDGDCIARSNEA